jgi:hypothetical protein
LLTALRQLEIFALLSVCAIPAKVGIQRRGARRSLDAGFSRP